MWSGIARRGIGGRGLMLCRRLIVVRKAGWGCLYVIRWGKGGWLTSCLIISVLSFFFFGYCLLVGERRGVVDGTEVC